MELKIEYISVNNLKPYKKNNKKHEDFDVEQIAKSISKYEMIDPVGIWGKDNTIVEGHGRVLACKRLGIDKVPCIRLDHLTDEQRREYAIVHNKSSELALYDFNNLADELAELDLILAWKTMARIIHPMNLAMILHCQMAINPKSAK